MMIQRYRHIAFQLVRLQCYLVTAALPVFYLINGLAGVKSLALGGLTGIVPTLYFARTIFAKTGAQAANQITRTFYRAEAVKLLLTGLLFVMFITYFSPLFLPYFIGFMLPQAAFWFGPLLIQPRAVENK